MAPPVAAFCCLDQMGGVGGADASSAIPNAITDSTAAGTLIDVTYRDAAVSGRARTSRLNQKNVPYSLQSQGVVFIRC